MTKDISMFQDNGGLHRRDDRQIARLRSQTRTDVARVEAQTVVRVAVVQAEGLVQAEKSHEVDRLTRTAMEGMALLRGWGNHLAKEDLALQDDMRFFCDIAKMAKGELIADSVAIFRTI